MDWRCLFVLDAQVDHVDLGTISRWIISTGTDEAHGVGAVLEVGSVMESWIVRWTSR